MNPSPRGAPVWPALSETPGENGATVLAGAAQHSLAWLAVSCGLGLLQSWLFQGLTHEFTG